MPKKSVLQFINYEVDKIIFEQVPVSTEQHEFALHPRFEKHFSSLENKLFDATLSFEVSSSEEHPLPFHLYVSLTGHFQYEDDNNTISDDIKDHILHKNTISILVPFLRSIVASLTTAANIPPLILPVMNFADEE